MREPQPYSDRALFQCSAGMLRYIKRVLQGEDPDTVKFYQATISTNAQADLWRMADLTPDGPVAVTKAAMFELMAAAFQIGRSGLVPHVGLSAPPGPGSRNLDPRC